MARAQQVNYQRGEVWTLGPGLPGEHLVRASQSWGEESGYEGLAFSAPHLETEESEQEPRAAGRALRAGECTH